MQSEHGCDSIVLLQLEYVDIFIPNVFSPNGDGINDLFGLVGSEDQIETYNIIVHDRWGNQIYNGAQWDGKLRGVEVNPGVYSYITTLQLNDGMKKQFQGTVTVIR